MDSYHILLEKVRAELVEFYLTDFVESTVSESKILQENEYTAELIYPHSKSYYGELVVSVIIYKNGFTLVNNTKPSINYIDTRIVFDGLDNIKPYYREYIKVDKFITEEYKFEFERKNYTYTYNYTTTGLMRLINTNDYSGDNATQIAFKHGKPEFIKYELSNPFDDMKVLHRNNGNACLIEINSKLGMITEKYYNKGSYIKTKIITKNSSTPLR